MKSIKIVILLATITLIGCTKKTVQIPVLDVAGIQDTIYDNSQLWIFHEVKDRDTMATLNRKNSIATTSWIFNIDKKLPMHLVIPHLQKLITKREKPALHQKGEDDFNYFSYVDAGSSLLSMVQFDVIYFDTNNAIPKNQFVNDSLTTHVILNYMQKQLLVNDSLLPISSLDNYFTKNATTKKLNVHLNFDKNMNYQNYLHLKAQLQNANEIVLDTIEYVY